MDNLIEGKFGGGGIPDTQDDRDYVFAGAAYYDWSRPYDIETIIGKPLTTKDQNGSYSCGGQAWGYYGEVLDPQSEKSSKFIYAQTYVAGGGSAGRDNCNIVIKQGWAKEGTITSYENGNPPAESFMERPQDITEEAKVEASKAHANSYAIVPVSFENIANAVAQNKGVIICVGGMNNGTWLSAFPKPPTSSPEWYHWLYVGKLKMENGKKYIGVKNSWGASVGENGWQWLGEEYANYIYSVWTLQKKDFLFKKDLKFGMFDPDIKELQNRLSVPFPTGFFGILTLSAVKKYQREQGLPATGFCGPLTRARLNG